MQGNSASALEQIVMDRPFGRDYPQLRDYQSTTPSPRRVVSMNELDRRVYFRAAILDQLGQAINDPSEHPLVRERLAWLERATSDGSVILDLVITSPPGHETAIAFSAVKDGQRYIGLSAPQLLQYELELKPAAFRDLIVFAVVHETMHETSFLARVSPPSRVERVREEAHVYARMVPIVRAWYAADRHPGSGQWKIAKYFREVCGDDPQHPAWLALIEYVTGWEPKG